MPVTVLDSYALIAYFRGEPAGVPVKDLLQKASKADKPVHMTEVNYAETKCMILRKDGAEAWSEAAKVLVALPVVREGVVVGALYRETVIGHLRMRTALGRESLAASGGA